MHTLSDDSTDPWRAPEDHPVASSSISNNVNGYSIPISPNNTPRTRRPVPSTPTPSRKGKEKAIQPLTGDDGDDDQGVWSRLTTMDRLNVLATVVDSSGGRDKVLKVCQYAAKSYIWLFLTTRQSLMSRLDSNAGPSPEHISRLSSAASSLSLARKCLRLFGPIPPFNQLVQADPLPPSTFYNCVLAFLTACADDMYCLSKLGLISKRRGLWADKWANRFWLLKSVSELLKLHFKRVVLRALFPRFRKRNHLTTVTPETDIDQWEKEKQEIWTARKLWCDVIHASYNVFRLQTMKEPVQTFTGLAAGLISASQLLRKEEVKLFKAVQR
ncbi:hypothetical protein QFC24_006419 [Naganishia onofrii]|uniref:Uncharacterized protein n=1 Tax=Naganishia onofrii TaxID=1851511 RepID=A0ACC2X2T5_9TREE|nr:hypothetical protein QFC24_006419 [Naganishia onofrii]